MLPDHDLGLGFVGLGRYDRAMTIFTARFTVTGYEPSTIPGISSAESSSDWVSPLVMRKTYTEGIVGEGLLLFMSSGIEESRGYLAAERITGTLDGVSGEVTIHHGAVQHPEVASAFGYIIPGTGTGAFSEWKGAAKIEHDADGAYFEFTLG
ncbi:MAG: DUF3224 domain-containing protein [Rhodoglobus sp.]